MSTILINQALSRSLEDKLIVLQDLKPYLYPKFNKIVAELLVQVPESLSAEQLSKLAAKQRFALGKIAEALNGADLLYRLAKVRADLEELWAGSQGEDVDYRIPVQGKWLLQLFEFFKRGNSLWASLFPTSEEKPVYLPPSPPRLKVT